MARNVRTHLLVAAAAVAAVTVVPLPRATASEPPPRVAVQIVGGTPAAGTFTWMVSLQRLDGGHFCGGALIAPHWVLTAGHCAKTNATDPPIRARVGSTRTDAGGALVAVRRTVVPGDYVRPGVGPDIALVRLARDVDTPALPVADRARIGSPALIMGWGLTCTTQGDPACEEPPVQLRQLNTRLDPPSRCGPTFSAAREWCVDNPGGDTGACNGDSGGPMVIEAEGGWRLIGTASRLQSGHRCGTAPTIYTNSIALRTWIEANTGS